jgi:hypothetical protein
MANGMPVMNLIGHAQYMRELTALLVGMEGQSEADSISAAIMFRRRWRLLCPDDADPFDYLVGLHRQRFKNERIAPELRGYSGKWLHERGYSLDRDKVFAGDPDKPLVPKFRGRTVVLSAADPVPPNMRFAPSAIAMTAHEIEQVRAGHQPTIDRLSDLIDRYDRQALVDQLERKGR